LSYDDRLIDPERYWNCFFDRICNVFLERHPDILAIDGKNPQLKSLLVNPEILPLLPGRF
jgi:hypothetical protein